MPAVRALSRRELLVAAAGGTAVAVAGGAGAAGTAGATLLAQTSGDAAIVAQALSLEQVVVASYEAALRDGPRIARLTRVLQRFQRQEREHAEVLASELDALGGRGSPAPRDDVELQRARARLGLELPLVLVTEADVARFAIELENAQMRLYLAAVRELGDGRLLTIATQMMAAEGQHATVLRGLLTDEISEIVPSAFETGDATIP